MMFQHNTTQIPKHLRIKKKKIRFELHQAYKMMQKPTTQTKQNILSKVKWANAVNKAEQFIEGEKVAKVAQKATTDPFQGYKIDKKVFKINTLKGAKPWGKKKKRKVNKYYN